MARTATPWYWAQRDGWYVTRDGQRHPLGGHPPGSPAPRQANGKWNAPEAVRQAFHALMARPKAAPPLAPPPGGLTLAALFDKYLDWCKTHRAPRTFAGYLSYIQAFCTHVKTSATMPALALKPFHVVEWVDAHPTWGPTYRRNAIAAVQRAFSWAEEMGHVAASPVRKIRKPAPARREEFVSPGDWALIRDSYKPGDPFREFLEFCWLTGARPHEAKTVEARHVVLDKALIAIPPKEAKGRKKWRLIRLEGGALDLVAKRLPGAAGVLFVNADGNPWTSYAINCRFCRLQEKLGKKFCNYQFRHGFANRLLVSGVDHLTVAALLGHSDGTMLAKVYSHVHQAEDYLRAALRKDGGGAPPEEA